MVFSIVSSAQEKQLADGIIAIVGDNIILKSEIEIQYQQYLTQGIKTPNIKCQILEQLLTQHMLQTQALVDSILISDEQVEGEMNRRLRYFINLIGSEEKLTEYYNKSLVEIKDEFREDVRKQLLADNMKSNITKDIKITPSEVKVFFNKIPEDSLPYYNTEVEVGEIVIYPKISKEQEELALFKIKEIRERLINGENFATLAILYSEDPGSASKGGELGFMDRGSLVPEFEAVAYKLKEGEISEPVKTKFGLHIIKLISRQGERINVRHILIKAKNTSYDLTKAKNKLDSVRRLLLNGKITFEEAVKKFSEEENTKHSGGLIINNKTSSTYFETSELDPAIYFDIAKLNPGEYTLSLVYNSQQGKQGYRILFLKSETEPHIASLKTDYSKIQAVALSKKKETALKNWLERKVKKTYIYIGDEYNCSLLDMWIQSPITQK